MLKTHLVNLLYIFEYTVHSRSSETHICPDKSVFLQLFWLQQICLFKSSLTKGKVLHTAMKMDNVRHLFGGRLGSENVFTKMCGSTWAADSSLLAISCYLGTFLKSKLHFLVAHISNFLADFFLFFTKCMFLFEGVIC